MRIESLDLSEARAAIKPMSRQPASRPRAFGGAEMGRLTQDWVTSLRSIDIELREQGLVLRRRAREMASSNPHAAKFLRLVTKNVLGADGIKLQPKNMMQRASGGKGPMPNQKLNQAIFDAFMEWCKKSNCTIERKYTFIRAKHLTLRTVAKDGEVLVRRISDSSNPFGMCIQLINPDQLAFDFNTTSPTGNQVRMGVEADGNGRATAYWIYDRNPFDYGYAPANRIRVPASDILHLFLPMEIGQSRGFTWFAPAMYQMHQLRRYAEAEEIAARVGASQMGGITMDLPESGQFTGQGSVDGNEIDNGRTQQAAVEPGGLAILAPGEHIEMFKPEHPTAAFKPFMDACLMGVAAGLDCSYMALTGDLSNASYSSARVGLLDERDSWAELQTWFIEEFCEPIFSWWLESAFINYAPLRSVLTSWNWRDYDNAIWHPRSFPWVDPQKDATAEQIRVLLGFTTRSRVLGAQGYDFEETVGEWINEAKMIQDKAIAAGLDPAIVAAMMTGSTETIRATGAQQAESDTAVAPATQAATT